MFFFERGRRLRATYDSTKTSLRIETFEKFKKKAEYHLHTWLSRKEFYGSPRTALVETFAQEVDTF